VEHEAGSSEMTTHLAGPRRSFDGLPSAEK